MCVCVSFVYYAVACSVSSWSPEYSKKGNTETEVFRWPYLLCVCVYNILRDKTKYMVMSREKTAGLSHTMKADNSSIERVEEFKHLGTTLTNQNSIRKEIKSRLKSGNACYHSVQNLLSSSLLFKNLKIKIYRTTIFPLF